MVLGRLMLIKKILVYWDVFALRIGEKVVRKTLLKRSCAKNLVKKTVWERRWEKDLLSIDPIDPSIFNWCWSSGELKQFHWSTCLYIYFFDVLINYLLFVKNWDEWIFWCIISANLVINWVFKHSHKVYVWGLFKHFV